MSDIPHWHISLNLLLVSATVFISFLISKVVRKLGLRIFSESAIILLLGLLLGLINYYSNIGVLDLIKFNTGVFEFVILPAIIFESGYSLRKVEISISQ